MSNKIIQWNCRGIRANYKELLLLLNKYNPKVVCLQETFLQDKNQLNIKHFQWFNHLYKNGHRASVGVSILVWKDILQQQINIDRELQVIVVKTTLHKPVNIRSIYIPPHDPINDKKLDKLIEQIPRHHILLGDLNSHNTIWEEVPENKQKGTDLKVVINRNNLFFLNNKSATYLNSSTGSYSSYVDYTWRAHDDPCGSDHFPIILKITQPTHDNRPPCWKTNKADWQQFKTLCDWRLVQTQIAQF